MSVRKDGQDVFKMAFTLNTTELLAIENADTASSLTLVCSEAQVVCNYLESRIFERGNLASLAGKKQLIYFIFPKALTKYKPLIIAVFGLPEYCPIFYSPPPAGLFVPHRHDISTFLDNLMAQAMKTVYFIFFVVALHMNAQLWSEIISKMKKKVFWNTLFVTS